MELENDEIDLNEPLPSVTERYYTSKYKIDVVKKWEDHRILVHSNRICVLTIAESHPILEEKKTVTRVNYSFDGKVDRLKNNVSGKSKRGAQRLQADSAVCKVTCSDDSQYTIRCCLNAGLIEVNERLVERPNLLNEMPDSSGYIAILLTNVKDHDKVIDRLLSKEQYLKAIDERKNEEKTTESNETDCKNKSVLENNETVKSNEDMEVT